MGGGKVSGGGGGAICRVAGKAAVGNGVGGKGGGFGESHEG